MKIAHVAISGYIVGLLTFYLCATFDTLAWDIVYFGWSKVFDCSILFFALLYHSGAVDFRKKIKWLYFFSFIRFAADIQSFFTGVGVNNNRLIAVLFLILIAITGFAYLWPKSKFIGWMEKKGTVLWAHILRSNLLIKRIFKRS
jgi:hypothetical protein